MIDLMEIGRRLWEEGEAPPSQKPEVQRLQTADHLGMAGNLPSPHVSAATRNLSAASKPQPACFSANPQNPHTSIAAPAYEAEAIISALVEATGRDLGLPLINRLRDVLAPMDRPSRANLAAAIDDAITGAQSAEEGQQKVAKLLGASIPRQGKPERLAGRPDWITWIARQCPLLPEDRAFILRRLHTLPPRAAERAARRYVETWQTTAEAELKPQAKDNRGRTAANRTLLALIR